MSHVESTREDEGKEESIVASQCTDLVSLQTGDEESEKADNLSLFTDTEANTEDGAYVSKLEGLGPIILNADGTMGRIPNWLDYTDSEKEQAIRLISARNKKRKEALLLARQAKVLSSGDAEENV